MNEYIKLIQRETETKYTSLSLYETDLSNLIHKTPITLRVGRKYLTKKFPGSLDVPIELNIPHRLGELHSILFVKEKTFSPENKIVINLKKNVGKKTDSSLLIRY